MEGEDRRQLHHLHQNLRSQKTLRAERPHSRWRDGGSFEMQMARPDRLSPVWSTLTPVAEMSLFKRRIVPRIGRQGRLVMIALLWLSATENEVFILCQSDVSSLISPMRTPLPPPSPAHHHQHRQPLNLLSWFGITVQRHGSPVQPATITANEERCSSHICLHVGIRLMLVEQSGFKFACLSADSVLCEDDKPRAHETLHKSIFFLMASLRTSTLWEGRSWHVAGMFGGIWSGVGEKKTKKRPCLFVYFYQASDRCSRLCHKKPDDIFQRQTKCFPNPDQHKIKNGSWRNIMSEHFIFLFWHLGRFSTKGKRNKKAKISLEKTFQFHNFVVVLFLRGRFASFLFFFSS